MREISEFVLGGHNQLVRGSRKLWPGRAFTGLRIADDRLILFMHPFHFRPMGETHQGNMSLKKNDCFLDALILGTELGLE